MRLDPETLARVDEWRDHQGDRPSRAEAIRRLIEVGLASTGGDGEVLFTNGDKLVVAMLGDLLKHLKVKGDVDVPFVQQALFGGHYWGFKWRMEGLFHDHVDKKSVVGEVGDMLSMWSFVESSYKQLSAKEKKLLETELGITGKNPRFLGFDANNEEHYGVAHFMILDLERFDEFKSRKLNSHMPVVDMYRRMLEVFERYSSSLVGSSLSVQQLIEILKARIHPSMRGSTAP